MSIINVLNIEPIRDFIYDRKNIKVLIGSRRVGKTAALCFSTIRDMSLDNESDILFCCSFDSQKRYIKDTIKKICEIYDYEYEMNGDRILINDNALYIKSIYQIKNGETRGLKLKHLKVDEPFFAMNDFKGLLEDFKACSLWADKDDVTVSVAGTGELVKELAKSCNVSRYIARGIDIYTERELEETKKILDDKSYKSEVLLESNDEPFSSFF